MLIGPGTSAKLQFSVGTAGDLRFRGSIYAASNATPPVMDGTNTKPVLVGTITGSGTQDAYVGVVSVLSRFEDWTLRNNSTTVTTDVTPIVTDGTTPTPGPKFTLLPGESLVYAVGQYFHLDTNGGAYAQNALLDAKKYVVSDVTFATAASFADVTGLTVPLLSGRKYAFEAHLYHISNATTTGAQFGVNIGAAPTLLQIATIDTVTASVTASVHSAGAATARDTAATAQTTGSVAVTMAILSGFIQPSADGTFAIRCTSEVTVASGVIVKAGSWLRLWECN